MSTATARNETTAGRSGAGVWWSTPGLAPLLGICPLLAASRTFAGGLALGGASLVVLCASNVLATTLGPWIAPRLRWYGSLLLIAALVTTVDLFLQARWFDLYGQVGLFVPLIVTNCLIQARAEALAAVCNVRLAFLDGFGTGVGFIVLLAGLGALRQLLAPGLLVAALPAGAFFLLAALTALRQLWLRRRGAA